MTPVNTATGEIVNLDKAAAERRAERITLRLDAIADNYNAVLPMIREAIEKRDDLALGYRSPGDYVRDRFGRSLANLGIEVRRAVVGELTEAGLSTRAIAPVVGVHHDTVARDARRVVPTTPEPEPVDAEVIDNEEPTPLADDETVDVETGEIVTRPTAPRPAPLAPVIGIDGKQYKRPERKPRAVPRPAAERTLAAIQSQAAKAAREAQTLTPDQIRRVRAEAGHFATSLRNSIEVLQHLVNSLDNKESK